MVSPLVRARISGTVRDPTYPVSILILTKISDVYVGDLANACVLLIEEALKPEGGSAQWGLEGYYFVESGEFAWKDIAQKISQIAKDLGAIETAEVDQLSVDEASKFHPWAPVLWGGNCRSRATRLQSLGWKPQGPTVFGALPDMFKAELDHQTK